MAQSAYAQYQIDRQKTVKPLGGRIAIGVVAAVICAAVLVEFAAIWL